MDNCIFCKIVKGDIPSKKVFEDNDVLAFHDIHPIAPVHFMIIPKQHIASLAECNKEHQQILGKLLAHAPQLAKTQGLNEGFRTIINTGKVGGQEVPHLHIHIVGGKDRLPPMLARS